MALDFSIWKQWTQARIGLGRSGHGLSTREILEFKWAHASARDAVLAVWDAEQTKERLNALGENAVVVESQVGIRQEFLKRPDLGRVLSSRSAEQLKASRRESKFDVVCIISDGLSTLAIENHLLAFLPHVKQLIDESHLRMAPWVLAPFSRVALSDEIGFALDADVSVMFIGERPGLSAVDSLGVYLTYGPRPGRQDSERNCISNIRPPHGLSYEVAARKLIFLIKECLTRKLSGIHLKEIVPNYLPTD